MLSRRAATTTAVAVVGTAALLQPQVLPRTARSSPHSAVTVIAHRGASAVAPENTLPAVDRAAQLGITWVENDVQRTRDGELVVIHDSDLKRTTNVEDVFPDRAPWKVADLTAAEIARLDAGSWHGGAFKGTRVPTLKQYLERVEANRQNLLLEIKEPELYPGIENDIVRTLGALDWLDHEHVTRRLVVQSFSAESLRTIHGLRPGIVTGYLGEATLAELPSYAEFTDQINPDADTLTADYVRAVHALRGAHGQPLQVSTWTVDDEATVRRVAGYGVDGIITNVPDRVRTLLADG